jgi:RNA polymerase sigma factor (sigma-70 family)
MPSPTSVLLRTQSDDRLVALARAGQERAFEAIVERYRRPLVRACRRVLPEARAEDAVQQALMAAWTGLRRGDEVRELRPWLYRIAHNTALNQLRVSGYDYDELHDMVSRADATAEEEFERHVVARSALAGLAALPERQREALLQIAIQGRGQDEVARALGVSEPAVRQLVHRARTHLRTAATAFMPMPLAAWLASSGARGATLADRVSELVAAGGGGAAVAAAKVGAVVVLAGGAVASPSVVDRLRHGGHAAHGAGTAQAATTRPAPLAPTAAAPKLAPAAHAIAPMAPAPAARSQHVSAPDRRRTAEAGHESRHDDHAGSGPGTHREGGETERRSGGGGEQDDGRRSDSGRSGSDDGVRSGERERSHDDGEHDGGVSEPDDDHGDGVPAPSGGNPLPTPTPTPSSSGSGSGSGSAPAPSSEDSPEPLEAPDD